MDRPGGKAIIRHGHAGIVGNVENAISADISVIIPMMDEEESLPTLFGRLVPILRALERSYEIVVVNDGSTDGTLAALRRLQGSNPEIVVIDLSRNFGKEAALTAGLFHARGKAVIPIDADLQDPPELIARMVEKWDGGSEVVLAVRSQRDADSWVKRRTAETFYRIMNAVGEISIPPNAGDFRLMDRKVVEALKALPERTRFNKGIFAWLGFRTDVVEYERPAREAGATKWKYRKLWAFALDGITSFSSAPLRAWSYIGGAISAFAFFYGLYIIFKVVVLGQRDTPGYASIMAVMLFSNGIILIGLGVIGEYLSRVFIETKGRPLFIIRDIYEGEREER